MSPLPRLSDRTVALALALFAFGIAGWVTAQSPHSSFDDSFYYLKIAQNAAAGKGSTFDGIHLTNGYHPLWLGCLAVIFWIAPGVETAALAARVFQGIIFAASAGLGFGLARNLFGRGAAILTCLVWILFAFREALDGMEYGIYALGIIATMLYYQQSFTEGIRAAPRHYAILGILVSATVLARLDGILLAPCVGIFLLWGEWRTGFTRESVVRSFYFAAPIALTAIIYAVANQAIFGLFVPVSGIAKRVWSDYYVVHDPAYPTGGWLAVKINLLLIPFQGILQVRHLSWLLFPISLVLGAYGAPLAVLLERELTLAKQPTRGLHVLAPFVLFSALNYQSYMILFQDWIAYTPWYFVIQPIMTAMLFGASAFYLASRGNNRSSSSPRWQKFLGAVVGAAISVYISWSVSFPFTPAAAAQVDPLVQAAQWLAANTPADATVGSWNAGIVGYYSQRRVINLDGLVNSWDYFSRDQFDLCGYWQKNRVAFLADYFEDDRAVGPVPVYPYYQKCADQMELVWSYDTPGVNRRAQIYRLTTR